MLRVRTITRVTKCIIWAAAALKCAICVFPGITLVPVFVLLSLKRRISFTGHFAVLFKVLHLHCSQATPIHSNSGTMYHAGEHASVGSSQLCRAVIAAAAPLGALALEEIAASLTNQGYVTAIRTALALGAASPQHLSTLRHRFIVVQHAGAPGEDATDTLTAYVSLVHVYAGRVKGIHTDPVR